VQQVQGQRVRKKLRIVFLRNRLVNLIPWNCQHKKAREMSKSNLRKRRSEHDPETRNTDDGTKIKGLAAKGHEKEFSKKKFT
jgi:hypothetical protein